MPRGAPLPPADWTHLKKEWPFSSFHWTRQGKKKMGCVSFLNLEYASFEMPRGAPPPPVYWTVRETDPKTYMGCVPFLNSVSRTVQYKTYMGCVSFLNLEYASFEMSRGAPPPPVYWTVRETDHSTGLITGGGKKSYYFFYCRICLIENCCN